MSTRKILFHALTPVAFLVLRSYFWSNVNVWLTVFSWIVISYVFGAEISLFWHIYHYTYVLFLCIFPYIITELFNFATSYLLISVIIQVIACYNDNEIVMMKSDEEINFQCPEKLPDVPSEAVNIYFRPFLNSLYVKKSYFILPVGPSFTFEMVKAMVAIKIDVPFNDVCIFPSTDNRVELDWKYNPKYNAPFLHCLYSTIPRESTKNPTVLYEIRRGKFSSTEEKKTDEDLLRQEVKNLRVEYDNLQKEYKEFQDKSHQEMVSRDEVFHKKIDSMKEEIARLERHNRKS